MENSEILHHHNEGRTPPDTPHSPEKTKKLDDIAADEHTLQVPVAEMAKATLDGKGKST